MPLYGALITEVSQENAADFEKAFGRKADVLQGWLCCITGGYGAQLQAVVGVVVVAATPADVVVWLVYHENLSTLCSWWLPSSFHSVALRDS